jgi:hypothetical protein
MRSPNDSDGREAVPPWSFGPAFRRGAGALGLVVLAGAGAPALAETYGPQLIPAAAVIVETAPPPLRTEVVPVRPGPHYVWQRGYWAWRGRWAWVGGVWVTPPRVGAHWVPGHWRHRYGDGWVWVPGHWR